MKNNTCLFIDVWEGQLDIDEAALRAGGVVGMSIRLNDMNGGHHMDTGFIKQWVEAENFIRFPYFVYNPWVDGMANFNWMKTHMPPDAKAVAVDVEVAYAGYAESKYAGELVKFLEFCKPYWRTLIYTAEWFLPKLSAWPRVDYWWAQYPSGDAYFKGVTSWDELKLRLDRLDKPFNAGRVPGTLKMWQVSGDYLTLPGTTRKIDVNIFYGSEAEFADYIGGKVSVTPPVKAVSGLYTFAPDCYWERPGGGPLTLPMTHVRGKMGDNISRYEWSVLAPVIRDLNAGNPSAIDLVAAPDWGPSKGLDGNYIKWIGLLWPGRNIVKVEEIVNGWGRIDGCPISDAYLLDVHKFPSYVHEVYDYNRVDGWGERAKPVYVPILGGPWYVEMSKLVSVDSRLPREVRALAAPWLNVRRDPSASSPVIGRYVYFSVFSVFEVALGDHGIWGRVPGGWVALRYRGQNLTNWKI